MTNKIDSVRILDVNLSCCSFRDVMLTMQKKIDRRLKGYISITNTESVFHATRLGTHRTYINNADISCCDGVGVVLVGRMLGYQIPRLHGPDLMQQCCEFGLAHGWRHYFYGGSPGVPERVSRQLTHKYPHLITAGSYSPPYRPIDAPEKSHIIDGINASKPDILWVGLGLLKQERWIENHFDKIEATWMVGVGAAFDFHAGTIKRAPQRYQKAGLEWFYRLVFEPRMLIRNYYSLLLILKVLRDRHKLVRSKSKRKESNHA